MKMIKRIISALLCIIFTAAPVLPVNAEETFEEFEEEKVTAAVEIADRTPFDLDCRSAILMDAATGTVLYEKNPDEGLPPASVTKIMTLLLVMEAIDGGKIKLEDKLSVSEYAASMGGSQVYLEPGEEMTVNDLIKCVVVSSANDAAVTLAEAVAGTETSFITMMNEKAKELGMSNSNFENATGLDDTTVNHMTSARDIAAMSKALMAHPLILQYSTIWMDTVRDGAFGLSNTNRLIRFYKGATGLKTGSTAKAGFCISATACREGLHLIAVIMGSKTRDIRNEAAKTLLDYGFANFSLYTNEGGEGSDIKVLGGYAEYCKTEYRPCSVLLSKGEAAKVTVTVDAPASVKAPVSKGDVVGTVRFTAGDKIIGETPLLCAESVDKIGFFGLFLKMLEIFTVA